ncbi:MAG TPA: ribonuclease P protein component [Bacteroidia bacterium]|nr:ribonuclease P protein component [Bacteroidia bacterium]
MNQTFSKSERLTAKTNIERLFKEPAGSFFAHPLKFSWINCSLNETVPAQILITVSKKHFKKAHDRNRVKRQLREVYRKNKSIAYDCLTSGGQQACFLLSYVGKEHTLTATLENKVALLLKKFTDAMAQNNA